MMTVVWDVNPVFVRIGGLEIMWYGLCWMAAIMVGYLFFQNFFKREGLNPAFADKIFWWGTLATIIGARLGHCFFYEPAYYFAHPVEILYIRDGGLASHGAAVGLLIGMWGFTRQAKLPFLWAMDRIMVPVALGGALVRIGNLINSEIYGRATDLAWGFIFVRRGETVPMHPTQIYEALCYLATFAVLWWLYYRRDVGRKRPGVLFGVGLIGIFLTRFLIEFIKNPQIDAEIGWAINMGQILSIPFILAGVWLICFTKKSKV